MSTTEQHILRKDIEASFAASLEQRVARSSGIQLHQVIPNHWFSAAGSECVSMYVGGYFYGCISIAQAYVEALSKYLIEHHKLKNSYLFSPFCHKQPYQVSFTSMKSGFFP